MSHASHESGHREDAQASDGVNLGKVVAVGVVSLALFAVGIVWAVYLMHSQQDAVRRAGPARELTQLYKAEVGIVDMALFTQDGRLKAFRSERTAWLNSYGWSDRKAGLIHTPIEQAMAAVVAEASRPETSPQLPPSVPPTAQEPVKPANGVKPGAKGKTSMKPASPSMAAPGASSGAPQGAPH